MMAKGIAPDRDASKLAATAIRPANGGAAPRAATGSLAYRQGEHASP